MKRVKGHFFLEIHNVVFNINLKFSYILFSYSNNESNNIFNNNYSNIFNRFNNSTKIMIK